MRLVTISLAVFFLAGFAFAENPAAKRILAGYQALRPASRDLAMYRLDWAESLDVALKRAARENRPVCLVIIFAKYGDMASGHC
jgi:hypothetical protein